MIKLHWNTLLLVFRTILAKVLSTGFYHLSGMVGELLQNEV